MHWLYLLLSVASLGLALATRSAGLMLLLLLCAAGFLLAWALGWYRERVGERSGSAVEMIDPAELYRLRQLAEARRREAAAPPANEAPPAP